MDLLLTAADQTALEGITGITLTKLWFEIGRIIQRQLTDCQKYRIVSYLLDLPQYKCYTLDNPRKLTVAVSLAQPLNLYGKLERNYTPLHFSVNVKNNIASADFCENVTSFGFCPERNSRVELENREPEDILLYDPDRVVFVASYTDRIRVLLPPDFCVEDIQSETYSNFMLLEYLAKCRERGAFIQELKDDWASGLDVYPLVSHSYRMGIVHKVAADHYTRVILSRFVDRTNLNMSDPEETLPEHVVLFDNAMKEYQKTHPQSYSIPKKYLLPMFGNDNVLLKKKVELMKAQGYLRSVYVKKHSKNKFGEEIFAPQLERLYPKPKLQWSNSVSSISSTDLSPEIIEPYQTMASLYRDCLTHCDYTIKNFCSFVGCIFYVARGVDKHFSVAYANSINVRCVEIHKTITKVRTAASSQTSDVLFLSDAQPVDAVDTANLETSKDKNDDTLVGGGNSVPILESEPSSVGAKTSTPKKRSDAAFMWKEFLTHDLSEFGIVLTPDDFLFKHKFFRTDLQKLRRAIVLKTLEKLTVFEINLLASRVSEIEKEMGMSNPPWDRKSRKRFMDILSAEGLISQMGVKYDRSGIEKEVHLIVLPGIDENHPLVHKLVNDKATVRYLPEKITERNNGVEAYFNEKFVSETRMQSSEEHDGIISLDGCSNEATSFPSCMSEQSDSVLFMNSVVVGDETMVTKVEGIEVVENHEVTSYVMNNSSTEGESGMQVCSAGESHQMEQEVNWIDQPQPLQLQSSPAVQTADRDSSLPKSQHQAFAKPPTRASKLNDFEDVTFGKFVPYMHCAQLLHRILLYKVYGIDPNLPKQYYNYLDQFVLSPCVYERGWILYADIIDVLPMKILGMFLERHAYKDRYRALGNSLFTSYEVIGLCHPTVRSFIITNPSIGSRIWCFVKVLANLGLFSLMQCPNRRGERKARYVYITKRAAFYDTKLESEIKSSVDENQLTNSQPNSPTYPVRTFDFIDAASVKLYWDSLRNVCLESNVNPRFKTTISLRFFSRKYILFQASSISINLFHVENTAEINSSDFLKPRYLEFGVAGTEAKLVLQDPVHWLPLDRANSIAAKLLNVDKLKTTQVSAVQKLNKKLAQKAVYHVKRKQLKIAQKVSANMHSTAVAKKMKKTAMKTCSTEPAKIRYQLFRCRDKSMWEKQQEINLEISSRKLTSRVSWSSEEDTILVYAFMSLLLMRTYFNCPLTPYGFFIRDLLHELLPQSAFTKNELSITRRFRYLMNNDYRCMLCFFGIKNFALKTSVVLNSLKEPIVNLKDDELYSYFKSVYNALNHCNRDWITVDASWTITNIFECFELIPFFPPSNAVVVWDFSSKFPNEAWKSSLHESILSLTMSHFFEKTFQPYSCAAVVLAKLISVPHVAEIMGAVFERVDTRVIAANSKMMKVYGDYRRFLGLLKLELLPKVATMLFTSWLSKTAISKCFVSIYENDIASHQHLKSIIGSNIEFKASDEDMSEFFMLASFVDLCPCYTFSVQMTEPLFEYPLVQMSLSKIENNRALSQLSDDEDYSDSDIDFDDTSLIPDLIPDMDSYARDESVSSMTVDIDFASFANVSLIKDDVSLQSKQKNGFDKADKYRSFINVTSQEKDQKILMNFPEMTLARTSVNISANTNIADVMQDLNFEFDYCDISVGNLYDLLLVRTPTDKQLVPQLPLYITTNSPSVSLQHEWSKLSGNEKTLLTFIRASKHKGVSFDAIVSQFAHLFDEKAALIYLELLLTTGFIHITGYADIKFCYRDFCPFFTSLSSNQQVDAHCIPPDSTFKSIKFLPNAFINWDGSFCRNLFGTLIHWLIETITYIPGTKYLDLYDRVSPYISSVQFAKVVKLAERVGMLTTEFVPGSISSDSFFPTDAAAATQFTIDCLHILPKADGILRLKSFCEKFGLERHLTYIGSQRLNFYASLVELFKTRKLFDPHLHYYD